MKKLILLLIFLGWFTGVASSSQQVGVSLLAKNWDIRFSPGMPKHPAVSGIGWEFDFPLFNDIQDIFTSVNYVTTTKFAKLHVGQTISMQFLVLYSPDAVFEYAVNIARNPCPRAANVRMYFQNGMSNRWFATEVGSLDLVSGGGIINILITPDLWGNVNGVIGSQTVKSFNSDVQHANAIGFTFGGGCFAGHGVWLSQGTATFILQSFTVQ